jgi:protein involved in polysaccharide export with SLBB domain
MVLLAAVSPKSPLAAQTSQPNPSAPVLNPGDAVRITVWRKEELSGEFTIAGDSTIAHPLYRTVKAAGVPLRDVEARVRQRLLAFEGNPEFVVEPLFRVSVGGEVRAPALFTLRPEVTILQAVARAGGLSERARLDRVRLIRDGTIQYIDLSDPQSSTGGMLIHSGDQIYVERRRDVLREYIAPVASIVAALASLARVLVK